MTLLPSFTTAVDGTVAHVTYRGDLAYDTGDYFVQTVEGVLPDVSEVHVDCSHVEFCDSYGLAALLLLHRRLDEAGVALHLVNRSVNLDKLLKRTNTLRHLTNVEPDHRRRLED